MYILILFIANFKKISSINSKIFKNFVSAPIINIRITFFLKIKCKNMVGFYASIRGSS